MLAEIDQALKDGNVNQALKKAKKLFDHKKWGPHAYQRAFWAMRGQNQNKAQQLLSKGLLKYPSAAFLQQEYGGICFQLGNYDKAYQAYSKILETYPKDKVTLSNVIQCCMALNDPVKAEEYIHQAIRFGVASSSLYNILASIHQGKRQDEEAKQAFLKAIYDFEPNVAVVYNFLQFCDQTKDHNTVEKLIDDISKEILEHPIISLQLGILNLHSDELDQAEYYFTKALQQPEKLQTTNLSTLNFEYGKVLDKKGDFEQAFQAFEKGNSLFKECHNLSNLFDFEAFVSAQSEIKIDGDKGQDNSPVFVLGFPRSGTTLLDQLLSTFDQISTYEETSAIAHTFQAYQENKKLALAQLQEVFIEYYQQNHDWSGQTVMVDRSAPNVVFYQFIKRLFPESKVIFIHRHPMDVILSCFMQNFEKSSLNQHFLDIGDTAKVFNQIMKPVMSSLSDENVMHIRYEDLVADFEVVSKKVCGFLSLKWDPSINDFHVKASQKTIRTASAHQVSKPLYGDAVNRWQNYQKHLSPYLDEMHEYSSLMDYKLG